MGYFQVRYESRVVNYERKLFKRLAAWLPPCQVQTYVGYTPVVNVEVLLGWNLEKPDFPRIWNRPFNMLQQFCNSHLWMSLWYLMIFTYIYLTHGTVVSYLLVQASWSLGRPSLPSPISSSSWSRPTWPTSNSSIASFTDSAGTEEAWEKSKCKRSTKKKLAKGNWGLGVDF